MYDSDNNDKRKLLVGSYHMPKSVLNTLYTSLYTSLYFIYISFNPCKLYDLGVSNEETSLREVKWSWRPVGGKSWGRKLNLVSLQRSCFSLCKTHSFDFSVLWKFCLVVTLYYLLVLSVFSNNTSKIAWCEMSSV